MAGTVTDAAGASAFRTVLVLVSQNPIARFTTSEPVGIAGRPLVFDASLSVDPENSTLRINWDFGDGTEPVSGPIIAKVFEAPGTYPVTLTITDPAGQSATAERIFEVLSADRNTDALGIAYSAAWDLKKSGADTLALTATLNIGTEPIAAGTLVAIEIAGVEFRGTLDKKLTDKGDKNAAWKIAKGSKKLGADGVTLSLKVKKTSLGQAFTDAGAGPATDPKAPVSVSIPVRVEIGARSVEMSVPSRFTWQRGNTKAKGGGETD